MDRIFAWSGLSGRSLIPMLSSFACAIPGIMSARVIPDYKTRLATILVTPLMSCSARLPVYILMIGAFIQPRFGSFWAAFTLFVMHAIGPILSLLVAKLISTGYRSTHRPVFFLEMPPYRMPYLKNIFYRGYHAASDFLKTAGKVILVLSVIIWFLSYFPRLENLPEGQTASEISKSSLGQSYLGRFGKTIQPVFEPLGFDWRITIGILSAFPAREVIISSLGILYNIEGDIDEAAPSLREKPDPCHKRRREFSLYSFGRCHSYGLFRSMLSMYEYISRHGKRTQWLGLACLYFCLYDGFGLFVFLWGLPVREPFGGCLSFLK